jgi:hypothetical protein
MSANIDSSIRRTILPPQEQGSIVSDTRNKLEALPKVTMSPGVARPSFKFEDGDGLTDDFGNVYEGYGGAGGSSKITSANGLDLSDLGDVSSLIPTDEQVLTYDNAAGLWKPEDVPAVGGADELDDLSDVGLSGEAENDILSYIGGSWGNYSASELGLVELSGTPEEGDLLQFVSGEWVPVTNEEAGIAKEEIVDYVSAFIEKPKDKTYILTYDLPYDITLAGHSHSFGTGSGTVNFQTGSLSAGRNITAIVSGLSGDAADLSIRINFTHNLNDL